MCILGDNVLNPEDHFVASVAAHDKPIPYFCCCLVLFYIHDYP